MSHSKQNLIAFFNKRADDIKTHLCNNVGPNVKLTARISSTNAADGILNAALCIRSGVPVIITDHTGVMRPLFPDVPYIGLDNSPRFYAILNKIDAALSNIKLVTPTTYDICKIQESFNTMTDQFINQSMPGLSLLACGINDTRLSLHMQQKYGEKGDKNFISDIPANDVLPLLQCHIDALDDTKKARAEQSIEALAKQHVAYLQEYSNRAGYLRNNYPPKIHKVAYPQCIELNYNSRIFGRKTIKPDSFITPGETHPMPPAIYAALNQMRYQQGFYDADWAHRFCNEKIAKIIKYAESAGRFHFNIAVSGGIDSAVVALILKAVCQRDERFTMTAILLPIQSTPEIQNRGKELCKKHRIPYIILDFTAEHADFCNHISKELANAGIVINPDTTTYVRGCAKSNFRGFVMYCISLMTRGLIIGTGNQDEDAFLRFYSVYGDGYVDLNFIGDVPKHFMYLLGQYLNVSEDILRAAPSADLVSGSALNTDAEEIGTDYTYAEFLLFILRNPELSNAIINPNAVPTAELFNAVDRAYLKENMDKIVAIHLKSAHKIGKPGNVFSHNMHLNNEFTVKQIADAYKLLGI